MGKLYRGTYFRCRHCYDIVYESQREDAGSRAMRRARNIRQRLGGSVNLTEPFPVKPKWMHRQKYHRLWDRALTAEEEHLAHVSAEIDRLYGRAARFAK